MFTVASLPLRPTDRDRTGVSAPLQFSPSPSPPAQITRDNAAVRTDAAIRETIWKERVLILNLLKTRRSRQFDQKREDGLFTAAADGDLGSESAARAVHILLLGLHSQPSRYGRHREYLL